MLKSIARSRRARLEVLGIWGFLVVALTGLASRNGLSALAALALVILGAGTGAIAKLMFELSTEVRALRSTVDQLSAGLEQEGRERSLLEDSVAKAYNAQASRLDQLSAGLEQEGRERSLLEDSVANALQAMHDGVAKERRSRALDSARQRSSGNMPERLLLQMTVPRTASTLLFELLRAHPSVYVEPLAFIWTALFGFGRRYPTDLSDIAGASVPLEVVPGGGCYVRSMQPLDFRQLDPATGPIALEEAHPEFFAFDVDGFRRNIDYLAEKHGVEVQFVYQIRQPLEVMWSFAEYKARSPKWKANVPAHDIPIHIAKHYDSLAKLQVTHPGVVIDFEEIKPESDALRDLARILTPDVSNAVIDEWLARGFERADLKVAHQAGFVAERDAQRGPSGPGGAWLRHQDVIQAANTTYAQIRSGLPKGSRPRPGHPHEALMQSRTPSRPSRR